LPAALNKLLSQKDKTILFAGIGNLLKMDDGVGVYISSRIRKTPAITPLNAEVSIENYIGKINSLNPDILVIIDCADLKSEPGTCKLIPVSNTEDITFNTHNISLKKLSVFFKMPVFVLGIQPEKVGFGEFLSYIVKKKADKIIKQINN
jgi:hydrogenase 3 maturation protease